MSFLLSKQLLGILLLVGLSLMSCQNQSKSSTQEVPTQEQALSKERPNPAAGETDTAAQSLTEDQVVDLVFTLPITQKVHNQISKATQGQRGVSVIVDPQKTMNNAQEYYEVRIGYNGEDRYETYHILYVNKQDKNDILVVDTIEDTIIPLAQWEQEK
ncbi:hypothetical protein [uncultured Capnocytophaga sp.]|uniref:hypothetical protein n=1 Tax=uncultured Capnocytophaga sp. TaxID=159273 RepID=UPI00261547CE|nr:hypothetical protein [uncultured Capnocytophaga sp.]